MRLISDWLSAVFNPFGLKRRRPRRKCRELARFRRTFRFEHLEARELLTVTAAFSGGNTLTVNESAGGDTATISHTGTTINVNDGSGNITITGTAVPTGSLTTLIFSIGAATGSVSADATDVTSANGYTALTSLAFNGGASNDTLSVATLPNTTALTAAGGGGTDQVNLNASLSISSISISAATTALSAATTSITTSGAGGQSYSAVTLGANTNLSTGGNALRLGAVTGATHDLSLDAGSTGAISGTSVSGVRTLTVANSGGTTFAASVGAATLTLTATTGTIAFNGGVVITTALSTAAAGYNLTVTGNASSSVAGSTSFLNTGTLILGTVSTDSVTFIGGLTTTGGPSAVNTAGTVATSNTALTLGAFTELANTTLNAGTNTATLGVVTGGGFNLTSSGSGTTTFSNTVSGVAVLSVTGASNINTTSITTTGAQTYSGVSALGADTTLSAGSANLVKFSSTVNGTHSLTIGGSSNAEFDANVGGTNNLTSLSVAGTANLGNVSSITITTSGAGGQTYGGAVTLAANETLTTSGGGSATFNGTLTLGTFTLNTGNIAINSGLSASVGGTASSPTIGHVSRGSGTATIGASAALSVTVTSPIPNKNKTLDLLGVNSGGTLSGTFSGLTQGTTFTSSGYQFGISYTGGTQSKDVVLTTKGVSATTVYVDDGWTSQATLNASDPVSGGLTFGTNAFSDIQSAINLVVDNGTVVVFDGTYSAAVDTANAPGVTFQINKNSANGSGTSTVIISGAVTLSNDTTFALSSFTPPSSSVQAAANLTFSSSTVDSWTTAAQSLTVNAAASGQTLTFASTVGASQPLSSITVSANLTTAVSTATVTTSGSSGQTYNGAVTLSSAPTLTAGSGNLVKFASTVNGATALSIGGTSNAEFDGVVGGTTALTSLSVGGATKISTTGITTSGASGQTYSGAVTLTASPTLAAGSGKLVKFGSTLDGAFGLTVSGTSNAEFDNVVGGATNLTSLSVAGTTKISTAGITTSGLQTYTGAVTLGANTTLTATASGNITLSSTVDGGFGLLVQSASIITLGGAIGGSTALTGLTLYGFGPGTLQFNASSVNTSGGQLYTINSTLGAASITLTSTGSGAIDFEGNLDGASAVTVNTSGTTTFGQSFGFSTPLTSLTTDAGGSTQFTFGGIYNTTGAQTYNDTVTLGVNATFTTTNSGVTFASKVDNSTATARTLTVSAGSGAVGFSGAVGSGANGAIGALSVTGTGTTTLGGTVAAASVSIAGAANLNGSSVTTTGASGQDYKNNVTFGAATVSLNAGSANPVKLEHAVTIGTNTVSLTGVGTMTSTGSDVISATLSSVSGKNISGGNIAVATGSSLALGGTLQVTANAVSTGTGKNYKVVTGTTSGRFANALVSGTSEVSAVDTGATFRVTYGSVTLTSVPGGSTVYVDGNFVLNADGSLSTGSASKSPFTSKLPSGTAFNTITDAIAAIDDGAAVGHTISNLIIFGGTYGAGETSPLVIDQSLYIGMQTNPKVGNATVTINVAVMLAANLVGPSNGFAMKAVNSVSLGNLTTPAMIPFANLAFGASGTIDGNFSMEVDGDSGSSVTLGAAVGGTTNLASLRLDATPAAAINTSVVKTQGAPGQDYKGAVTMNAGAKTLTASGSGAIDFESTLAGVSGTTLATLANGTTTFGGVVSALDSLATNGTTSGSGTTAINANITTATATGQVYNNAVTMSTGAKTLTGNTSGVITFAGTLTGVAGTALSTLTNGTVTFGNTVSALDSLSTNGTTSSSGATAINANVTTTAVGGQTYKNAVTVAAGTITLSAGGTGPIAFQKNLSGTGTTTDLIVSSDATIYGTSGGGNTVGTLRSLLSQGNTATGAGSTTINAVTVTTTAGQTYANGVTLGANVALTAGTAGTVGNISFASTVRGAADNSQSLLVDVSGNATGKVTFGGAVGDNSKRLSSLTVVANASTGEIDLNGSTVTTAGNQSYTGPVVLTSNNVLTSGGGGSITFAGTVNSDFAASPRALTVSTTGVTWFEGSIGVGANGSDDGATGDDRPLSSLTSGVPGATGSANGPTQFGTGSGSLFVLTQASNVTTLLGTQTYNDNVVIMANTTFHSVRTGSASIGGNITFAQNLSGSSATLTVATSTSGKASLGSLGAASADTANVIQTLASLTVGGNGSATLGDATFNAVVQTSVGAVNVTVPGTLNVALQASKTAQLTSTTVIQSTSPATRAITYEYPASIGPAAVNVNGSFIGADAFIVNSTAKAVGSTGAGVATILKGNAANNTYTLNNADDISNTTLYNNPVTSGSVKTTTFTITGFTNGQVTSTSVLTAGAGYGTNATVPVTFSAPPSGGTSATGFAKANASGQIISITITSPGSGYTAAPTVSFGGSGTYAMASASIASDTLNVNSNNGGTAASPRIVVFCSSCVRFGSTTAFEDADFTNVKNLNLSITGANNQVTYNLTTGGLATASDYTTPTGPSTPFSGQVNVTSNTALANTLTVDGRRIAQVNGLAASNTNPTCVIAVGTTGASSTDPIVVSNISFLNLLGAFEGNGLTKVVPAAGNFDFIRNDTAVKAALVGGACNDLLVGGTGINYFFGNGGSDSYGSHNTSVANPDQILSEYQLVVTTGQLKKTANATGVATLLRTGLFASSANTTVIITTQLPVVGASGPLTAGIWLSARPVIINKGNPPTVSIPVYTAPAPCA
jgi:hypothetical protein